MTTIVADAELPVSFQYYGIEGDYEVGLVHAHTGQYVANMGYIAWCTPSMTCTGGYHLDSVCRKNATKEQKAHHYETKEESAQALFDIWTGRNTVKEEEHHAAAVE